MNLKKLTADVVLQVATTLINNNGSTTTLDVKRELRKQGEYYAFQSEISTFMQQLANEAKLASTNDSSRAFQVYDLPQAPTFSAARFSPTTNEQKVIRILVAVLNVDEDTIKGDLLLEDDLGMDDLDRVEIIMKLESEFNFPISDDIAEGFKTVQDIFDYLDPKDKKTVSQDTVKDLLQNGSPQVQDILIILASFSTVSRKDIANKYGGSKADTAFASLVKKGILKRTATGIYAWNQPISATPASSLQKDDTVTIAAKDKKIQELLLQLGEKDQQIASLRDRLNNIHTICQ